MEIFYNAFPLWTSIHYKLYYAKNIIIRDGINSLRLTGSVKNELVCYMYPGTKFNSPPYLMLHFLLTCEHMLKQLQMMEVAAGHSDHHDFPSIFE